MLHTECSPIALKEAEDDTRPALKEYLDSIDEYDTIYVGFPIWAYQEPMAVRTFLESYDFSGKKIIPFCTSMAVDIEQAENNIRDLCPDAEVKTGLRLRTEQKDFSAEIEEWLKTIEEN